MELEALINWLCGNGGATAAALIVALAALFGYKLPSRKPEAKPEELPAPVKFSAEVQPKGMDPATLALIIGLAKEFLPVVFEWIRERRKRREETTE